MIPFGDTMPFETRHVGFVDIVGFKSLVPEAASDIARFNSLHSALNDIATERPDFTYGKDSRSSRARHERESLP